MRVPPRYPARPRRVGAGAGAGGAHCGAAAEGGGLLYVYAREFHFSSVVVSCA